MIAVRRCRALLVTGALAIAARAAAAQEPPVPADRTLNGGSLIILGTSGFNAPMLAYRGTGIHREIVAPDLTAGLYLHNSSELIALDLGFGAYAPVSHSGAFTLTVGPSLLVGVSSGGGGAVVGLHGKAGVVLPFDLNLGLRLEVGGELYQPGQYTAKLWYLGLGITTLGIH